MHSRALIIFAKSPLPGSVKTRLTPPFTPELACEIYRAMLLDTLEISRSLTGVTIFLFFEDAPDAADFFATLSPDILSLPQTGVNLGERMENAFKEIFGRGFSKVAIIGTDSPDLPLEHIFEAFSLLEYEHTDVVFGPAEDGGYYLMALKKVWKELFTGLPWSSDTLLEASVLAAKDSCLGASFLPEWHDIDNVTDLKHLQQWEGDGPAARTREFLTSVHLPDNSPLSDS